MESLGDAAKRLLAKIDRDAQERANKAPRQPGTPAEIETEAERREGDATQGPGIHAREARGLEMDAGELSGSSRCNDALARYQRGNTYRYDFTNADMTDQPVGNARWIGMRHAAGAWPGTARGSSSLPFPANQARHACNDNKPDHDATFLRCAEWAIEIRRSRKGSGVALDSRLESVGLFRSLPR